MEPTTTGGPTRDERCPKCGNTIGNAVPAYSSGALRCAACKTLWSFAETPLCSSPPAAPEAIPEPTERCESPSPTDPVGRMIADLRASLAAAERRAADAESRLREAEGLLRPLAPAMPHIAAYFAKHEEPTDG